MKVKVFLEIPLHPDTGNAEGESALHEAAERGHNMKVVRCLLEAEADPNKADKCGRTALHDAALYGQRLSVA